MPDVWGCSALQKLPDIEHSPPSEHMEGKRRQRAILKEVSLAEETSWALNKNSTEM